MALTSSVKPLTSSENPVAEQAFIPLSQHRTQFTHLRRAKRLADTTVPSRVERLREVVRVAVILIQFLLSAVSTITITIATVLLHTMIDATMIDATMIDATMKGPTRDPQARSRKNRTCRHLQNLRYLCRLPGHAAQYSPYGNLPAWTPPQIPPGMNAHFVPSPVTPVSPVYPGFRSASMPVFVQPQPSSAPYPEARPPIHTIPGTTSILPPPPPLTPSLHPRVSSNPFRYSPNEVKKIEEHYKKFQAHEAESNKENEGKGKEKENDDFSQHIQHCHFCAACGAMRSKAYHKAHPLERGQIPERSYCHKCKDSAAAKGDNRKVIEEPAGRSSGAHGYPQGASQDVPTTDANRSSPGNGKGHKKNSHSWVRKARRLSLMSNMFPSPTASGGLTQPSETVASEEGSEYIPSAPVPVTKVGQDGIKPSASSSKQAVSSAIADASAIAVDEPSHVRHDSAEKHQGRVPAKIVQAKPSRSTNKPEKEKSGVAAQTHERSGPSSKTYDKIRIPSGAKKPEKCSRIPRPTNSKISSEATSNGSRKNAQEPSKAARMYHESQYNTPGPSNAARMYHESQYKAPAVADEEDENVEFPVEPSGIFETASSGVRWDGSHVEQTSSQAGQYKSSRGTKGEYKDRRKHDQRRKPSPMVPMTAESQEFPEFGQQEHTDYGRTGRHRDDTRAGRRGDREQRLRFADDVPLASPNHPDYTVGWDLPLTPSDPLYPSVDSTQFFTDDFWGLNKEHADPVEQEAQAFAEPHPASASKLFENSTNSGTGFSRIIPSFLTRSEISVESYGSNGGGPGKGSAGPSTTYKLDEVSETGGETAEDEDYKSVKKLGKIGLGFTLGYLLAKCLCPQLTTAHAEYSSKEDRDRKTAARTRTHSRNRSTRDLRSQDPHGSRSSSRFRQAQSSSSLSKKPREKNTYPYIERDDFGSLLNLSSPALGSSTVAHTGHSTDLPRDVIENDAPAEAGRRRRIRRPPRM
ncbi:hypothetical protein Hte_005075 [Hypoxylon texense]